MAAILVALGLPLPGPRDSLLDPEMNKPIPPARKGPSSNPRAPFCARVFSPVATLPSRAGGRPGFAPMESGVAWPRLRLREGSFDSGLARRCPSSLGIRTGPPGPVIHPRLEFRKGPA